MSIATAITTASTHQLSGVVVDGGVLQKEREMVLRAADAGLKLLTYGLANNDLDWIHDQHDLGVHAAIVDDVPGVMAKLADAEQEVVEEALLL